MPIVMLVGLSLPPIGDIGLPKTAIGQVVPDGGTLSELVRREDAARPCGKIPVLFGYSEVVSRFAALISHMKETGYG